LLASYYRTFSSDLLNFVTWVSATYFNQMDNYFCNPNTSPTIIE